MNEDNYEAYIAQARAVRLAQLEQEATQQRAAEEAERRFFLAEWNKLRLAAISELPVALAALVEIRDVPEWRPGVPAAQQRPNAWERVMLLLPGLAPIQVRVDQPDFGEFVLSKTERAGTGCYCVPVVASLEGQGYLREHAAQIFLDFKGGFRTDGLFEAVGAAAVVEEQRLAAEEEWAARAAAQEAERTFGGPEEVSAEDAGATAGNRLLEALREFVRDIPVGLPY